MWHKEDKTHALISTHTLRKEGDPNSSGKVVYTCSFQPTPSARRVTIPVLSWTQPSKISTHTLRKEGDVTGFRTAFQVR